MFVYLFVLSFSFFSLCNAMSEQQLFFEKQNKWIYQEDCFKKECADGALYLNHQQLVMILNKWNNLIKSTSSGNETLFLSDKRTSMYAFFDNPENGFHRLSIKLLKNALLNDNFIRLTWRADDLGLKDYKIATLQRMILHISTLDDIESSYWDSRCSLMDTIQRGQQAELYTYLQDGHPVNIIVNRQGETALIAAVKASSIDAVELLIACPNLAVNAQDFKELNTALHWAIKSNNKEVFELILNHPLLDINIQNATGKTPIMLAGNLNKKSFVEKILEKFPHVDLTITDHVDNTVFDLAHENLLRILSQHQLNLLDDQI